MKALIAVIILLFLCDLSHGRRTRALKGKRSRDNTSGDVAMPELSSGDTANPDTKPANKNNNKVEDEETINEVYMSATSADEPKTTSNADLNGAPKSSSATSSQQKQTTKNYVTTRKSRTKGSKRRSSKLMKSEDYPEKSQDMVSYEESIMDASVDEDLEYAIAVSEDEDQPQENSEPTMAVSIDEESENTMDASEEEEEAEEDSADSGKNDI